MSVEDTYSENGSPIMSKLKDPQPPSPTSWVVRNTHDWTGPPQPPQPVTSDVLGASTHTKGFEQEFVISRVNSIKTTVQQTQATIDASASLLSVAPKEPRRSSRPAALEPIEKKLSEPSLKDVMSPMPDRIRDTTAKRPPSPEQWVVRNVWEWVGPPPPMIPLEDLEVLRTAVCSNGFFQDLSASCAKEYEKKAQRLKGNRTL
eukprot:PhF_6_TR7249/c0_g1_i1/m.10820